MPLSNRLISKTETYEKLKAEARTTFSQDLAMHKLENELAHLHLASANLLKDIDLIAAGQHLQKAMSFNPYIIKEFSSLFNPIFTDATEYPTLTRALENTGEVLEKAAFVIGLIPGLIGMGIGKFATIIPNTIANHATSEIQYQYVESLCLKDIPNTQTAEQCLAEGIAHFHQKNFYLSIRYLLEAEIRSTQPLPGVTHFLNACFRQFLDWNPIVEIFLSAEETRRDHAFNFFAKLSMIKNKVLQGKTPPVNSRLDFIWNLNVRHRLGFAVKNDENFMKSIFISRTILELNALFEKLYPHLVSGAKIENAPAPSIEDYKQLLRLAVTTAHFVDVPQTIVSIILNDTRFDNKNDEEISQNKYFLQLSKGKDGHVVEQEDIEDAYTESLKLMLYEKNNNGLAVLQQKSIAKYWQKLYGENLYTMYSSMPLHLKNPLVYMHEYLFAHFRGDKARSSFFINIAKAMLEKNTVSFEGSQQFAGYSAYSETEKTFFSMIETLTQMSQKNTLKPAMIAEYNDFVNEKNDYLANQIKASVVQRPQQIFSPYGDLPDGDQIELRSGFSG